MTPCDANIPPPVKRRKLHQAPVGDASVTSIASASLSKPVSPPTSRRNTPVPTVVPLHAVAPTWSVDDVPEPTLTPPLHPPQPKQASVAAANLTKKQDERNKATEKPVEHIASPFQLTKIRDLAAHQNVDAVELKDVLGDPLIKECWNFNFLFDLDFVMQQFDEDVRDLVKVKVVHGFWKRDDERRIDLMETAERYPNVEPIGAYLPDPFGTHHSKMLVLFRHDDSAQVVTHTANMISKDWTNMTQAVWRSPLLPLRSDLTTTEGPHAIGSGERFCLDLRRYLLSYEKRLRRLVEQLDLHDFSSVRAAFLGSTPSRQTPGKGNLPPQTSFGWLGLQEILSSIPRKESRTSTKPPHIVLQVSSIATLGAVPTWLSHFESVLARSNAQRTLSQVKAKVNIVFPTAEEVRTSLDGYESGGSIHMKIQSAQQQKQLQYLLPLLCHWKSSSTSSASSEKPRREAHRGSAAPHIKTYIRFSDASHTSIDWALLTSANLSKQAWGDVANKQGEVRIQSYETGVLIWPELFACGDEGCEVSMVPTFGKDMPDTQDPAGPPLYKQDGSLTGFVELDEDDVETEDEHEDPGPVSHDLNDSETEDEGSPQLANPIPAKVTDKGKGRAQARPRGTSKQSIIVGLRMPYDLPLKSYSADEAPWCATQAYTEADWKGRAWGGY